MLIPFRANNFRMTSPYAPRINPVTGRSEFHYGLDLVCDSSDDVVSVADGVVTSSLIITDKSNATWQWGNYVKVTGDDGVSVYYCHLASRAVSAGQKVKKGDLLGKEGATGQVTGKHLHFECRRGTERINAADYIGIANAVGTYTMPPEAAPDYAKLVAAKCGLEAQTAAYINQYRFAADLWRKLWEAMA